MLEQIAISLTALYLRGVARPIHLTRRRWPRIVSCLRTADCGMESVPQALRAEGFWEEAVVLEHESVVLEAQRLVEANNCLTAVHPNYPKRWLERLGQAAPPALWIHGSMPENPFIGIVGSRNVEPEVREFAFDVGRHAVRLGFAVVSGGAVGCDHAGAAGAIAEDGYAVEILPYGIDHYDREDRCGLSACAPEEIFTTASAMERNTLIYAASEQTVVAHARFKEGGTWIGAVEATRRHLCPLIVRDDAGKAAKALIGLGGAPILNAGDLSKAMAHLPAQTGLFGIG